MSILKYINKRNLLINFPSVLFISLPILLISGPFLSDLAVSLIVILFLINIFQNRNFEIFNDKFFKIFLLFWIYLILNSLFQNQNFDSIKISLFYFRFGFFVYAVAYLIDEKSNNLKYFYYCLVVCYLAIILDGFFQFFTGKNVIGHYLHAGPRVSSFFGDELIMGSYICRLFPILFGIYIYLDIKDKSKYLSYLLFLIFILSEVLIFLSGERTAFFHVNFTAIFMILLMKNYKKIRIIALMTSLLIIIFLILINPETSKRIITQTLEEMNLRSLIVTEAEKKEKIVVFTEQHSHHYLSALKMYKDNILFGVGVKNFRKFCSDEKYSLSNLSCSTHPHNIYIQLLAETGTLGFLFIFYVLCYFTYYIIKHFKLMFKSRYLFNDFQICLLASILITLWPIAPSGNFFNNWLSIFYYLPFGFILQDIRLKNIKI